MSGPFFDDINHWVEGKVSTQIKKDGKDYCVVRCPIYKKNMIMGYKFFAFDISEPILGKGSFGTVCKAYQIDATGEFILDNKTNEKKNFAAKVFDNVKSFDPVEADILNSYYPTESPVRDGERIFLFTEFVPGKSFANSMKEIAALSFYDRVKLLSEIMYAFNIIHHDTKATKNALVHADVKPHNINLEIIKDANGNIKFNVFILDFGLAIKLDSTDNSGQEMNIGGGTLGYVPPESFKGIRVTKSDIYALTPIFAMVLGARDPLMAKVIRGLYDVDHLYVPYNYNGMLKGKAKPDDNYPYNLLPYIHLFLDRMQHLEYDKRPDTLETMTFTASLRKFCETYTYICESSVKKDISNEILQLHANDLHVSAAKLALISYDIWDKKTNTANVMFSKYDFESNVNVCILLARLGEANLLSMPIANLLLINPNDSKQFNETLSQINIEDKLNLLSFIKQQNNSGILKNYYNQITGLLLDEIFCDIYTYIDVKDKLIAKGEKNSESPMGDLNQDKRNAAQLLVDVYKTGNTSLFFSNDKKSERYFLHHSGDELKKMTQPLVEFLDKQKNRK